MWVWFSAVKEMWVRWRNGGNLNMINTLVTIRNDTPCLYVILHTRDLEKCWLLLHFPGCWLDFGGPAELAKMIIGLEPPLLPWVADEKKVVVTFLMKARALVTWHFVKMYTFFCETAKNVYQSWRWTFWMVIVASIQPFTKPRACEITHNHEVSFHFKCLNYHYFPLFATL
jgi:hypothetical protein